MAGTVAYYGNIVRDGLVLDLDAAKRDSYPGSGTVWRDIAGGVITGSLVNGPTFDSANGGSIVFDGVDDYVNVPQFISTSQDMTFSLWFKPSILPPSTIKNIVYLQAEQDLTIRLYSNSTFQENNLAWLVYYERTNLGPGAVLPQFSYTLNTWTNTVLTFNQSGEYKVYINGTIWNTTPPAATFIRWLLPTGYLRLSSFANFVFNGSISNISIYNRALSATEVLQNYNALKGRYGL
jgi:hypothetical protein